MSDSFLGPILPKPFGSLNHEPNAIGDDEKRRPLPADEPTELLEQRDLLEMMQRTIKRLAQDKTSRGDLKILNRTLRELRYAFKVFQPYRRRRKITIFGSARTPESSAAYQAAIDFSREMARHGWMVITGAGNGIMEAGHRGAGREMSMGLNIMLPFEQRANEYIDGDPKLVTLKYFFTRKLMFVKECSAVACLPGGFGTLDETLEVLTLVQTGKQTILPIVLLDEPGGRFWNRFHDLVREVLLVDRLISPEDLHLYRVVDRVEDAVNIVLDFYRVYHSMRYVEDRLVLRINQELTGEELESLNIDFADILKSGKIVQQTALPEESNEPELAHLPRLVLSFDRKSLGRLRQLIDAINAD